MRTFKTVCFVIALLTISVGAIFAKLNFLIDWEFYTTMVAIVGGISSILLGLLSLIQNPLSNANIEQFSSESLKKLADTADKVIEEKQKLDKTNNEIKELKIKQNELEVLVNKASLSMYYKKELARAYNKLATPELNEAIEEIKQLETDLKNLNEEIDENKDIKEIIRIVERANFLRTKRLLQGGYEINFFGGSLSFTFKPPF